MAVARTTTQFGEELTQATNPCLERQVGDLVSDNPLKRTNAFRTGEMRQIDWSGRGGGESYNYFRLAGQHD
jgi:hypothetical protein